MASLTFELTAGVLLRRRVIRQLRRIADGEGVEFSYDEDKGWLDSLFVCKAEGADEAVLSFQSRCLRLFEVMVAKKG